MHRLVELIQRGPKVPSLFVFNLRMDLHQVLLDFAKDALQDPQHFIVDVILKGVNGGKTKILVLLDGDEGVNIDDCARLSRQVASRIEAEELIEHAFILEVSSPGVDHPLQMERQYIKNVGRNLKLTLQEGEIIQGELMAVEENSIQLNKETKNKKKVSYQPVSVTFDEIEKANVLVSFK